ncbi:MAG: efflux RND transporter permease subunit [Verrucomicrobia bacterium]|nr:MAG: efflux RND transporter permease subunit [Verrucomicrobiota bacterium]
MPRFAIRFPYFIIVLCLFTCVVGVTSVARMPVDLFPRINIPVVVVATFYGGMPPEQIENDITGRFERFFTLASGVDHIESRSLPGVSLIKVYFQPGMDGDSAVSVIANLASANLRRLPPGTLPPVVLKFDASILPVCLITLKGEGLTEARLRDLAQYTVRNQVANVPGASVPQPFGGKYRQIMVYVDPLKLEAHQLGVMDVVRSVNDANLILPAGDVRIGSIDYNLYCNSQVDDIDDINRIPLKTVNGASVLVGDIGTARDAAQIQNNVVRIDGQSSVYLPVLKQGGDANTIAVVDGIRTAVENLQDTPPELRTQVAFDQSRFVKNAIENLVHEGAIGLALTGLLILLFLGSMRATLAVFLSIPLSAMAAFIALSVGDATVNSMVLGGLALAFSRLIDNSVVVLENIFRHLELGESPEVAAEKGGREVALPVLASTLTTVVVFFPVTLLAGVSRFLFTALAATVVFSLFASYLVALTVVPLFCAHFIRKPHHAGEPDAKVGLFPGIAAGFNRRFTAMLDAYGKSLSWSLARPAATVIGLSGVVLLALGFIPRVGLSYFPRTDPGQFVVNLKAPTGTRLELNTALVARVEDIIRSEIPAAEFGTLVSNIGIQPGFSAIYTSNAGQHTAFVQASLREGHRTSTFDYIDRIRRRVRAELPQMNAYFQAGGMVDAVVNLGLPAPIDVQVSGSDLVQAHDTATELARRIRALPGVSDVLVPQDVDYPALKLDVDRKRAAELGLSSKDVIQNIVTALNSSSMIAPSFWIDPKSGNDYILTVQYPEGLVKTLDDLQAIPMRAGQAGRSTRLDNVATTRLIKSPTEVDHYQLRRVIDIYVATSGEDLGSVATQIDRLVKDTTVPKGLRITLRGMVQGMRLSFRSFGIGLLLSVVLVYLILVAQFRSFVDPALILLAVPTGLAGVILMLVAAGTTLNVMSLMGVVMMVGIVVSNSILIVDFAHRLRDDGMSPRDAVALACRVRLRPVLMTSLATLIGLLPMAAKLGTGGEAYAPLAQTIIGGLGVSVLFTVYIVPAAYLLVYGRKTR